VVDLLEGGRGLNLTWEVRDGILNHTGPVRPSTLEGQIVKIADRVAYINHDIDDAIRGGILTVDQIPAECLAVLGKEHRERINTMVLDLIHTNLDGTTEIKMSPAIHAATEKLRRFMFERVYIGSEAKREETKACHVVQHLYKISWNMMSSSGEYRRASVLKAPTGWSAIYSGHDGQLCHPDIPALLPAAPLDSIGPSPAVIYNVEIKDNFSIKRKF
jgi:dGTPase